MNTADISQPRALRAVIAADSFKGTCTAPDVVEAIAHGWRSARPQDEVVLLPQADGGEGTIDVLRTALPGSVVRTVPNVCGPDGELRSARWLDLADGTAVVELAETSGLPLMSRLDAGRATSRGLGQLLAVVLRSGVQKILVGLGGSASTDGGAGVLVGLGARLTDSRGRQLPDGGLPLIDLAQIDVEALRRLPTNGLEILCDTTATLYGPRGAASTFAPQKGADRATVSQLDDALRHWAWRLSGTLSTCPDAPGAGAAGGVGFALAAWGGMLTSGADFIAELTGLDAALEDADVVVTGEGQFDATSSTGKLVGSLVARARLNQLLTVVVAGQVKGPAPGGITIDLSQLAGSTGEAKAAPRQWLAAAGSRAARAVALTLAAD